MKTVVRRPNKTKAVVCLGAAVAVLVGGASTFARWAQDVNLIATDSPSETIITAGEWDLSGATELEIAPVAWYDTSNEVTGSYTPRALGVGVVNNCVGFEDPVASCADDQDTYVVPSTANGIGWLGGSAEKYIGSLTTTLPVTTLTPPVGMTATPGEWEINLSEFAVVPGDQLVGIFNIADLDSDAIKLVGEHLQVTVTAVDTTGAQYSFTNNDEWGDAVTAKLVTRSHVEGTANTAWSGVLTAKTASTQEQIAIVINYDYNGTDTSISKQKTDYCLAQGLTPGDNPATTATETDWCEELPTGYGDTMTITTTTPTADAANLTITGIKVTVQQQRPTSGNTVIAP